MVPSAHPRGSHHHKGSDEVLAQRMAAHDRLAHQSQVVLRLGQMLLSFGASAYRVKKSMADVARAVGISEHRAQVTYTEIITTAYANGTFRTELAEQRLMGVNADKIDRINNYIASINGKSVRVEDVSDELDKIAKVPGLYDWFSNALASGLACAAFAFLNGGGWVECSAVAVASFFGQALRRQMLIRHMNHFGVWMACGALAAMIYILLVAPAQQFMGIESTHQAGFISALLFLVPGFPLVTGLIDLVRQDFQGGLGRLVYVAMLVASAGVAVWAISAIFGWSVTPEYGVALVPWLHYLLRFLTSFVAAYGFAMLFNSPQRVCAAAALIGAVINTARIALNLELSAGSGCSWPRCSRCRSPCGFRGTSDAILARHSVGSRRCHHDPRCTPVPVAHLLEQSADRRCARRTVHCHVHDRRYRHGSGAFPYAHR